MYTYIVPSTVLGSHASQYYGGSGGPIPGLCLCVRTRRGRAIYEASVFAPSIMCSYAVLVVCRQENLTEALADLDAALEKELSRDCDHDSGLQSEDSSTKVEELEKQCKTLENELDSVKG